MHFEVDPSTNMLVWKGKADAFKLLHFIPQHTVGTHVWQWKGVKDNICIDVYLGSVLEDNFTAQKVQRSISLAWGGGGWGSVVRALDSWPKGPGHSVRSASGRLQLNTYALYICGFTWNDMVHGVMVYTETAAVLHGTSHVSAVSTPLWWIFKNGL